MDCERVYGDLSAAVLNRLSYYLVSAAFTDNLLVKPIGVVTQVSNLVAETVDQGKYYNSVLVWHVDALADEVQEQGRRNVKWLLLHAYLLSTLDLEWVEAVVGTTVLPVSTREMQ